MMVTLIQRIRAAMAVGLTREEIIVHFRTDYTHQEIFLAYQAALILNKD